MVNVRGTLIGIGLAVLAGGLIAGAASGELLTKKSLSLEDAKKAVAGAAEESRKNNWKMIIAVVDDGGHLIRLGRLGGGPQLVHTPEVLTRLAQGAADVVGPPSPSRLRGRLDNGYPGGVKAPEEVAWGRGPAGSGGGPG